MLHPPKTPLRQQERRGRMGGKAAFNPGLILTVAQQVLGNLRTQQHIQGIKE